MTVKTLPIADASAYTREVAVARLEELLGSGTMEIRVSGGGVFGEGVPVPEHLVISRSEVRLLIALLKTDDRPEPKV